MIRAAQCPSVPLSEADLIGARLPWRRIAHPRGPFEPEMFVTIVEAALWSCGRPTGRCSNSCG
jgi:hypothetical protein